MSDPSADRVRARPGRRVVLAFAAAAAAALLLRVAGVPATVVGVLAATGVAAVATAAAIDWRSSRQAWQHATPVLTRALPAAFAIAVNRPVIVAIANRGEREWAGELWDHADPSLVTEGLPATIVLPPRRAVTVTYMVRPTRRGDVSFAPAALRLRSAWGLWDLHLRLGPAETRRVYPDFAQVARYAWLAGDRRLQEIGVKTYQQRGQGTDFAQLAEYRVGDEVRHIDWKATLRMDKPIVRQFQDERDQCVMLLVDCGRRMRPDDRVDGVGSTHFDQVLNAAMLLTYVALKQGDAVGAMTFGTASHAARSVAPRKGVHALSALMAELYGVQPTLTPSDYLAAARQLLDGQRKRALVVILTNFRDEDGDELRQALRLLRARHLVLFASLRERVTAELRDQPLMSGAAAVEVASAHLYEQARRDAFNRLAARDALMVDALPERLGVELVNRYHHVKRAGLM